MIFACLQIKQGKDITEKQELGSLCSRFYRNLYKVQPMTTTSIKAIEAILAIMESKLPPHAYQKLNEPITLQELDKAVKEVADGKSPRLDGHAIEFYAKLWPIIGLEFYSMVLDYIITSELAKGMNSGLIELLRKRGPTNLIKNYRPITLLNVSYKSWRKHSRRDFSRFFQILLMKIKLHFYQCDTFLTTFWC